jgi:hypothetical protein
LQKTASKLPVAKGSASDQLRSQTGTGPASSPTPIRASADMRAEGSAPTTHAPVRARAAASWPKPLATSRIRQPGAARVCPSVLSVIRWNKNSLSRVEPVGITSRMSRSRSTTRMAANLSSILRSDLPGAGTHRRRHAAP